GSRSRRGRSRSSSASGSTADGQAGAGSSSRQPCRYHQDQLMLPWSCATTCPLQAFLSLQVERVLADPFEPGDAEGAAVEQPAHPAVAARGIRLVLVGSHRGQDAPAAEVPLLDLVVVTLDGGAKA